MSYNPDALIFEAQVVVSNNAQPAGSTAGSIINEGTLSTKDTFIKGQTVINNVNITPNTNDIIYERQATLVNNRNSYIDITDFTFNSAYVTSFKAIINVTVSTGEALHAVWEINGLYKPSGWVITSSFTGDITGVLFSMRDNDGVGVIQYTNSNTSGTTIIRYRASTTAPPGTTPEGLSDGLGVILNTNGNFISNSLIYANGTNSLASTDITYNSNVFSIGGVSRIVAERSTSFVNFSNGGAITSMGDASIAKNLIVGEKIGVANTNPNYSLDISGDINFTGNFYKNGSLYSGSEIWTTNGTEVFYTVGNIGFGTTDPAHQLDVVGGIRSTSGITTSSIISTSVTSGSVASTNVVATNSTVSSLIASNMQVTNSTFGGHIIPSSTITYDLGSENNRWRTLYLSNVNTTTLTTGTLVASNTNTTTLTAASIQVTNVNATTVTASTLLNTNAVSTNVTAATLNLTTGLTSASALITDVVATNISTGTLQAPSGITVGNINFTGSLYQNGVPYLGSQWTSTAGNVSYTSGSVSAINIDTTTITASTILANTITAGTMSLSGDLIVGGTLTTVNITTTNLTDINISTGTLNASSSTISNVLFTNISSSTLLSSNANITTLTAGTFVNTDAVSTNISSATLNLSTGLTTASAQITNANITTLTAGTILATTIVGSTSVSSGLLAATNVTATNIVATTLTAGALKTSDISLDGNLVATGDITAFGSLSDRRLKTNIIDIDAESALNTVKSLRPVTFDWRDDIFNESKRGSHDVGFIAQEVEEVVPQAVAEYKEMNSGTFYKNIKHERLIPYLVGAIQKLQLRIEELEKKI